MDITLREFVNSDEFIKIHAKTKEIHADLATAGADLLASVRTPNLYIVAGARIALTAQEEIFNLIYKTLGDAE